MFLYAKNPIFTRYNFLSENKKRNFSIFKQVAELMFNKQHLSTNGFNKLLILREKLNLGKGRTRKYTLENVLESSTTIRQGPAKRDMI